MKTLAIVLLGALLAYAEIRESQFTPGREYVYEYEGQVLSGLPKSSQEFSGLRISCKPRLQFKDEDNVIVQLDHVKLHRLQREIEDPRRQQPLETSLEVTGEEDEVFRRELTRPIRITYRDGKVVEIETSRDEPEWSINIKRGIFNLFQLNINERESIDQNRDSNRHPSQVFDKQDVKVMRILEESVSGKCESVYKIKYGVTELSRQSSTSDMESKNVMNITKIRNLDNCEEHKEMQKSTISGKEMDEDRENRRNSLKSISQVRYNVTYNKDNQLKFLIESAIAEGQHIYSPYRDDISNVVTFVNQTLKLRESRDISERIEEPRDTKKNSLRYEFPEQKELKEKIEREVSPRHLTRDEVVERKTEVRNILKDLTKQLRYETISEEIPSRFILLVKKLRDLRKEELKDLYDEVERKQQDEDDEEYERKMKLFKDTLPMINTEESVRFIKEKIERREFEQLRASEMLNLIGLIHDPSHETLEEILDLCKQNEIREQKEVWKTCWLSFGSLVNSAFNEDKKDGKIQTMINEVERQIREQEQEQIRTQRSQERIEELRQRRAQLRDDPIKKYTRNLREGIRSDKSKDERMICLKSLANAGLKDNLADVQSIIESIATKEDMKVQAIWSLRRMAPKIPSKVRNVLSPVYHNQENTPEVRIAAFIVMMDSNITAPLLQLFAQSLHKERSQQVGSFVFSHLKSLSNSTHPLDKQRSRDAKYALRFAKPIAPGAHYSKNVRFTNQNKELDMGFTTEVNTIDTPKSFIPRSANAKLSTNIFGRNMNILETGFRAEGLQTLVEKIVGPQGSVWKKSSVLDLLKKRSPRSTASLVEKERKQLKNDLPIKQRTPEEPKGSAYLKVMGNEIRFFTFDKDSVKSILEDGQFSVKDVEDKLRSLQTVEYQKAYILADMTHQIPTELGIPLQMNLSSAAVVHMRVEGRAEVTPSVFESKRHGQRPERITAEAKFHPKISMVIEGKVGVDCHVLKSGVGIRASVNTSLPLNGSVEYNLKTDKYITEIETPQTERQLVNIKSKPFTFSLIGEKKQQSVERRENEEQRDTWRLYRDERREQESGEENRREIRGKKIQEHPTEVRQLYGKKDLGVEFEMKTKYVSNKNVPESPAHPLCGPVEFNITVRPGDNHPSKVEIEVRVNREDKHESEEHLERHSIRQSIRSSSEEFSRMDSNSRQNDRDDKRTWVQKVDRFDWKSASMEESRSEESRSRSEESRSRSEESRSRSEESRSRSEESRSRSDESRRTNQQSRSQEMEEPSQMQRVVKVNNVVVKITGIHKEDPKYNRQLIAKLSLDNKEENYQSFHFELVCAPRNVENKEFKMCMQGEIQYPEQEEETVEKLVESIRQTREDREYLQQESQRMSRPINARDNQQQRDVEGSSKRILTKLTTQWGKSCENDKKVEIKARVEKSKDQLREEREKNTTEYRQCEEDKKNGKQYSEVCTNLMKKRTELHKVDVEISHERLPKWVKRVYSKAMLLAQNYLWNNMKMDNVEIDNSYNKVYITAELDKNFREFNFTINHPYENVKFERVQMPVKVQPMSTKRTYVQQWLDDIMNEQYTPYCKVRGDEIKTFDDVSYSYKLSKCEHVLAKDCSPDERFTVLISKKNLDSDNKITKIFVEDKKVELIPQEEEMLIRINGEQKDLKINEKMIVRKDSEIEYAPLREESRYIQSGFENRRSRSSSSEEERRPECEELRFRNRESLTSQERIVLRECERIDESYSSSLSRSDSRQDSRDVCDKLRQRAERGDYLTSKERTTYRWCEEESTSTSSEYSRSQSSEIREVTPTMCEELRLRDERNEYLNFDELVNIYQCKRVEREACRDLHLRKQRNEQLSERENEQLRDCERKHVECEELRRRDDNDDYLNTKEIVKYFHCRDNKREECKNLRSRLERQEQLSEEERETIRQCERREDECNELIVRDENELTPEQKKKLFSCPEKRINREECEDLRSRKEQQLYLSTDETERCHKCEKRMISRIFERRDEVSRQDCEELRRRENRGEYLNNQDNDKLRQCRRQEESRSGSYERRDEISRQDCEELRRRENRGEYLNNQDNDKLRQCRRQEESRSGSYERRDEVSRQDCEELRRRENRREYLNKQDSDKLRQCRRQEESRSGSYERRDEISRQECEEIRPTSDRPIEYLSRNENDKLRQCRRQEESRSGSYERRDEVSRQECEELRRRERQMRCECQELSRTEQERELSRDERTKVEECRRRESSSVEVSSKEENYWNRFAIRVQTELRSNEEYRSDRREEDNNINPIEFIVIRYEDNRVEVISTKVGLRVKSDGKNIKVEVSQFFRSELCGLCGNFDGEKNREFEGPQKEIYEEPKQFGLSYQVPSEKCSADATCLPRMRNVVIEKTIDGQRKTCFSTTPVSQCLDQCRKQKSEKIDMKFYCLESVLQSTQDLVKLSKTQIISKFTNLDAEVRDIVDVHTECARN
uniref:Vitellogenin-1-like isoform X2 n=1 Tax=Saccoglossus kowalevskii TaxID=10224 RepID=A0ABM0MY03_SACKO|nr:PREDICTED: vitellogenin-1-like isoform X2 [Saccoglossus kowalevskii]